MINISPINAFSDNYIWLLDNGHDAWVVDPGDATPVLQTLATSKLQLQGILITHHHPDHVGGVATLQAQYPGLQTYGPPSSHIHVPRSEVTEGDTVTALGLSFEVACVPGHTLDHIAYISHSSPPGPLAFVGDTLFAGGCGRMFEGQPAQMLASLDKLAALPPATTIYCAHEYTLANLTFAKAVEPGNNDLLHRIKADTAKRELNQPTVPTTIALELATNPFLRCREAAVIAAAARQSAEAGSPAAVFAAIRGWKDCF